MTIFHLLAGLIFAIAFLQGIKAGMLGLLISLVIGTGAAGTFSYGLKIFGVWLPKRLGIYELIRYKENRKQEELSARDKVVKNIYVTIYMFVILLLFVLCSLCSFYLSSRGFGTGHWGT